MRRGFASRLAAFVLALALALGGLPLPVGAAGGEAQVRLCLVTVTTDNISPPEGSLREKLRDATCDSIGFSFPGGRIVLDAFLPTITRPIIIVGPPGGLTIDRGERTSTVFTVGSGGDLTLRGLTLTGAGTGVSLSGSGKATLSGVTVTDNEANGLAFNGGGSATIVNSTIASNPRNGLYFNGGGTATVINSTIARNGAAGGVGISSTSSSGSLTLINTVLAKTQNANCGLAAGVLNAQRSRNNLADDDRCFADNSGPGGANQVVQAGATGLDPAGLRDNLGPTQTIALTATSPALNAGDAAACAAALTATPPGAGGRDQRGFPRPATGCDIGAFERQPPACTVTSTADDGTAGTLRACVTFPEVTTITFALPGPGPWTLTLASNLPQITRTIAITGPSPGLTIAPSTPSGTSGFSIGNGGNLTLTGLTITKAGTGLSLSGSGSATLTNATITGNTIGLSLLNGGTATLTTSVVSGGVVGVAIAGGGTATLTNSTVADNSSYGVSLIQSGTATLTNSTVTGSDIGVRFNSGGTAILTNSTVSGSGTGLTFESGGSATLINSTLAGNREGIYFRGGGLATLTNSTVADNTQFGLYVSGGSALLINTLLARNGNGSGCILLSGGTINAQSYNNLADDARCFANGSGPGANRVVEAGAAGLDPAGLKANGGPTRTIALLAGSPALDAGAADPCANSAGGKDQRGVARPQRAACDVGAFEAIFYDLQTATAGTGTGTVTADPAAGPYAEGTTVQLLAAPTGGSLFAGWTVDGVAAGSANPLALVIARSHTVVATFAAPAPAPNPGPNPSPLGPPPSFVDVPPGYWAHDQIITFAQRGITTGCFTDASGAYYCPERSVTRAEMAAFLIRTLTGQTAAPAGPATPTFADVPVDHPQYGYIEALVALGVTTGCGPGEYCPDRAVTRAEMAAFIIRAKTGQTTAPAGPATPTFADVPADHPQYGFIEEMAARRITTGCGDPSASPRTYCPDSDVTRAEMAVFVIRAYP